MNGYTDNNEKVAGSGWRVAGGESPATRHSLFLDQSLLGSWIDLQQNPEDKPFLMRKIRTMIYEFA